MHYPSTLAWSLLFSAPAFARLNKDVSQLHPTKHHRRLHPRAPARLLIQSEQSLDVHPRSQTVADLIDDPSIFERTLAAEAEELERRQLAEQEDWYGEAPLAEQSTAAARAEEQPEQQQDTPIQEWDDGTSRYTFPASHPPPSDLQSSDSASHPETIKNFAHCNAVGGDEDEDERVDQSSENGEDEEYDLNTIGEDEDYDLETIWDETDEYFLVDGESEEGEFYRVKRSLDPRASKGRKSKKGRKQTKSRKKKLSKQQGMLGYSDKRAGPSGATSKTTKRSGPNGSQAWLNNGISKSKKTGRWSPPKLKLSQLKTVLSLTTALKSPSSPYHACKRFLPLFNESAKRHSLPPILLAALAMQESSYDPDTRGGGGEHGLMQLIKENCRGRDSAACMEPRFNIETAAALFANNLKTAGGDILVALAAYNGWYRGMSYKSATQAARSSCCRCQQNLDYLHQMLNGWLLNISPYEHRLGLLRNLDVCGP